MNPLEAAVLVALCALPFHFLLQYELAKLRDPRYLRVNGIVIVEASALQSHARAIGTYAGRPIWESVTFMGMVYRYDRMAPRSYCNRVGPHELYMEPGLVYVTG